MGYFYFGILRFLLWPLLIIGVIVYFLRRRGAREIPVSEDENWYLRFSLSREDTVSQLLLLLAILFLWITLLAFNRDLGDPLSWRTVALLTSCTAIFGAYFLKVLYLLPVGLVGMAGWWGVQAMRWLGMGSLSQGINFKTTAVLSGLALLALLFFCLGRSHEQEKRYKRFAMVYLVLGIFGISAALFVLSTKLGLAALAGMTKGSPFIDSWQVALSLFLLVISLVGVISHGVSKKLIFYPEALALGILGLLFVIIALLPEQELFITGGKRDLFYSMGNLSSSGVFWAIIFNLVIFLELLGLIFSGYIRRESWLINLGALFLFLLIITKYFDWFFTFLDKSVFFIGAGILLFVVGWLMERGRRYMIASIK